MRRLLHVILLAFPMQLSAQAPAGSSPLTLRSGDVVELHFWREPTLSGEYPVDEAGRVTLPILGVRMVTQAPWAEVRDSLMAAFTRELREGAVRMTPRRRVYVLGFVQRPGAYLADPTVPIAGAIALAGGASDDGDLNKVRVMRDGAVLMSGVSIESSLTLADVRSGDQIYVDRRSWFDRNSPFMVSAIVGLAGIIVTLIVAK